MEFLHIDGNNEDLGEETLTGPVGASFRTSHGGNLRCRVPT